MDKQRAPRIKLKLSAEEKAELLRAMPEPDYTYQTELHGQQVTVKRYATVKPDPDDELTERERELRDEAELLRLHHLFTSDDTVEGYTRGDDE